MQVFVIISEYEMRKDIKLFRERIKIQKAQMKREIKLPELNKRINFF